MDVTAGQGSERQRTVEPGAERVGQWVRSRHPVAFRSGEWARIVMVVQARGRWCWLLDWPVERVGHTGRPLAATDVWPQDDPVAGYEFSVEPPAALGLA